MYTYIYTHTHTYIHTYIHKYIQDDYRVCLKGGVIVKGESVPCPVDDDGRFTAVVTDFVGLHVKDAGAHFTRFTGTKLQVLTLRTRACRQRDSDEAQGDGEAGEVWLHQAQLPLLLALRHVICFTSIKVLETPALLVQTY